ncbi:M20/M25/M40 family metallo-hydrolase [Melioribacteraceae bacterium 4301-Me]|uniref:M20/M25/M40 family metallo-hydrolase n=1 Tax=Pyranulibacter aquaticus TaxID=3163344 RepID=UPI003597EF74
MRIFFPKGFLPIILMLSAAPAFCQNNFFNRDETIYKMVNEISADTLRYDIEKLVGFKTRHTLSNTTSEIEGIGAARRWVKSQFEKYAMNSNGRLSVSFDSFFVEPDNRRITRRVELKNVIATLKGTDSTDNRIVVVGAHLDSRATDVLDSTSFAPGADDDASGVALVLELARVMSKMEFTSTIVFAVFSGEEQGLFGSKHLAEKAKSNNWNIIAMLNNDIVGSSGPSSDTFLKNNLEVRVFSEGIPSFETDFEARIRKMTGLENDSKSRQLARYIKEIAERYVNQLSINLIYRSDRFLRGGDHTPFNMNGFPAVRFCEANENYDHQHQNVRMVGNKQYGDLIEFLDFEYLKKIAGANLATIANLSLACDSPRNVIIEVKDLTNFTTLRWERPKGKIPYGFFVLIRKTSAPIWEKKIFVKDNSVTIPYSKDNFIFAVQSVDEQGHESLPVIPVPSSK